MKVRSAKATKSRCIHNELRDLVMFYLNGDVTTNQRRKLEQHLRLCAECQDELRFFLAAKHVERERTMAVRRTTA